MAPRAKLCAAGTKLRTQINTAYPKRDKASDGWIGDIRHKKSKSDHNPDPKTGIVRALDIDSDLGKGIEADELAEAIRLLGKTGDKRISYVIYNRRIASKLLGWKWRPYIGQNPHTSHIHVSFTTAGDTDGTRFGIKPKSSAPTARTKPNPEAQKRLQSLEAQVAKLTAEIAKIRAQNGL